MQALLSVQRADQPQEHRQRPPKDESAAVQEGIEKYVTITLSTVLYEESYKQADKVISLE